MHIPCNNPQGYFQEFFKISKNFWTFGILKAPRLSMIFKPPENNFTIKLARLNQACTFLTIIPMAYSRNFSKFRNLFMSFGVLKAPRLKSLTFNLLTTFQSSQFNEIWCEPSLQHSLWVFLGIFEIFPKKFSGLGLRNFWKIQKPCANIILVFNLFQISLHRIGKASISNSKSPSGCEKACPLQYHQLPKHKNNLSYAPLWPILVCNGREGGCGGTSVHYILELAKGGRTIDYFYALEADGTQGGVLFHSPKGFLNWILMLFLFGVKKSKID